MIDMKIGYRMIFISIFICSISFIMFSCKDSGEESDLDVSRGNVIGDDDYPSVVRLFINRGIAYDDCTGSIISSNTVLTAAHCNTSPRWSYVYKDSFSHLKVDKIETNDSTDFKKDIAIWILSSKPFINHPQKLQISDIDPKTVKDVRYVGWGCYTKTTLEEVQKDGNIYKSYKVECDRSRKADKRTGVRSITQDDIISEDRSYIKIYSSIDAVDKIDGVKQRGIGQNVSTAPGDSGSPLLIEEGSNTKKIIGVLYGGNSYVKNEELCVKEGYKEGSEIWRDCRFFSDDYSNPVSSYNMPFLEKVVDNYGAIIPGVQVGVRVIEYNGKVKILYKEEKTSFNENVEEYKVVSKFNNNSYNSVEALKKAWRGTDFYERSKASWVFE